MYANDESPVRCRLHNRAAPYACLRCGHFCCGLCFEEMARERVCVACEKAVNEERQLSEQRERWRKRLATGAWIEPIGWFVLVASKQVFGAVGTRPWLPTWLVGTLGVAPPIIMIAVALRGAPDSIRRPLHVRAVFAYLLALAWLFALGFPTQ